MGWIVYQDFRGWKYKVSEDFPKNIFKVSYHRPDSPENICWRFYPRVPWRNTFAEAQADLDLLAKEKNWIREAI